MPSSISVHLLNIFLDVYLKYLYTKYLNTIEVPKYLLLSMIIKIITRKYLESI